MRNTTDDRVLCPYYKSERGQVIYCDGISPDITTHVAFANKANFIEFKLNYCQDEYKKCLICDMLARKDGGW